MKNYHLESLRLPKLMGIGLRLFTAAVESPLTRWMLMRQLLVQGGIIKLRKKKMSEVPTVYPISIASVKNEASISVETLEDVRGGKPAGMPFNTIRDFVNAYRNSQITPEEVANRIFDAVDDSERLSPPLRAFIAMNRQDVMAQASASTRRLQEGKALSLFDGVPVAVKDEVDQVPYPTTAGTTFLGALPAVKDSTVVARLRSAGALLIGKANMHEIGINPTGLNVHYGTTRNPYDTAFEAGGSSSGAAAAVAANLCPVAIGADGGGSIRIPASLCGLVGLKATFGRVSENGAAPLCWSVAHIGPIGATVEDVALAYAVIAGPDPADLMSCYQPAVTLEGWNKPDLKGIRMGIFRTWFEHASADVVTACYEAVDKLCEAGGQVVEIEIPELDDMRIAHAISILGEMAASMKNFKEHHKEFADSVRLSLALGNVFTAHDYLQAQRMRTRALAIFADIYRNVDVIISPASAVASQLIPAGGKGDYSDLGMVTELMRYIFPGNLTGLPAISFPVAYNKMGLPVGMHAMSRHWQENLLLKIAFTAEQFVERKLPPLYFGILD